MICSLIAGQLNGVDRYSPCAQAYIFEVTFGRSVRFWKGFSILVFSVFDGEFFIIRGWWSAGRAAALHPGNVRGAGVTQSPLSKIKYLMSVSVQFGVCLASVGFAAYMNPTLM